VDTPPLVAEAARGKVELADIVRVHGAAFCATHRLSGVQRRALRAIEACRTATLGGHVQQCDACGAVRYTYHSCRNRHCPKCQTLAKERWLSRQRAALLPVPYYHVVFTLPHALNALAQGNPRVIYRLLFAAAAETLLAFGRNPRWLGGELGATLVLHTWGQALDQHVHVHALVTGGALATDGRWLTSRRGFLFPVRALGRVFRGKYLDALGRALRGGELRFAGTCATLHEAREQRRFLNSLREHGWVVYAKPPCAGPEQVLEYLGRYTHRVAISNNRLVSCSDDHVRFRWKDYAHGNRRKVMTLTAHEFLRRFLLHVLPCGFMRIRHYGLSANRAKQRKLSQARVALDGPVVATPCAKPESLTDFWQRITGTDLHTCPQCRTGRLHLIGILAPHPTARAPPGMP